MKFEDIDTVERASGLTGCEVFFPRELSDGDDGEMTWSQIVGYDIVDADSHKLIGRIASVDETTINVLLFCRIDPHKTAPAPVRRLCCKICRTCHIHASSDQEYLSKRSLISV